MSECNHPAECVDEDEECGWCKTMEALEGAQEIIRSLRDCLDKVALHVNGGEFHLYTDQPIGYFVVMGGTVYIEPGKAIRTPWFGTIKKDGDDDQ